MNKIIEEKLRTICADFVSDYDTYFNHTPYGSCYFVGHCFSEGLSNAGLSAVETTGALILHDNNGKNVFYGQQNKYKGQCIGYYHTWCVLTYGGEQIIIDPVLKYNTQYLKLCKIRVDKYIPDCIITSKDTGLHYKYIKDSSLVNLSKINLAYVSTLDKQHFINKISKKAKILF